MMRPLNLKPLENDIEKTFLRKAKKRGWVTRKMNGEGFRGWPDRYVVTPHGTCWIEFKRPKKTPRGNQEEIHKLLIAAGEHVGVFTDAESAVQWVELVACESPT